MEISDSDDSNESLASVSSVKPGESLRLQAGMNQIGRILVAEDQLINLEVIKSQLEELNLLSKSTFC